MLELKGNCQNHHLVYKNNLTLISYKTKVNQYSNYTLIAFFVKFFQSPCFLNNSFLYSDIKKYFQVKFKL